jgi:phospholipase C
VRVPAVLISPFIRKGAIDHRTFDHTSIPATLKQLFGLPSFLTARDAKAQSFSDIASMDAARTDTPSGLQAATPTLELLPQGMELTPEAVVEQAAAERVSTTRLSEFQQALIALAHRLELNEGPELRALRVARRIDNEYDGALYVREVSERFAQTSRKGGWV